MVVTLGIGRGLRPSASHRRVPLARRAAPAGVLLWLAGVLFAQDAGPVPTSVAAVLQFPGFFHGRTVLLQGNAEASGVTQVLPGPDSSALHLVTREALPTGRVEIVGQVVDVGRLQPEDPRIAGSGIKRLLDEVHRTEWPKAGEFVVCLVRSAAPAADFPAPSVRAVALDPGRYADLQVTVTGQFRGRNLYGDLPEAPGMARWEFVLRADGASIWVVGIRPRGRGFDLDPSARVDTSRWLEVSGIARHGKGLAWLEGKSVREVAAPAAQPQPTPPPPPPRPAPEVLFSVPSEGETDVSPATNVRIQFSRGLDPGTLEGRIRVTYAGPRVPGTQGGEPPPQPTTSYDAANRVLELRFPHPLERFRTLHVDLLEGIVTTDGAPLKPWSLTFSLGG